MLHFSVNKVLHLKRTLLDMSFIIWTKKTHIISNKFKNVSIFFSYRRKISLYIIDIYIIPIIHIVIYILNNINLNIVNSAYFKVKSNASYSYFINLGSCDYLPNAIDNILKQENYLKQIYYIHWNQAMSSRYLLYK